MGFIPGSAPITGHRSPWIWRRRGRTEGEHPIGDLVGRADHREVDTPILRAALCNLQTCEARRRRI
jgi:hypothetical protein